MEIISLPIEGFGRWEFSIIPPGVTSFLSPSAYFRKRTRNLARCPPGRRIWSITRPFAVARRVTTRRLYEYVTGRHGPWRQGVDDEFSVCDDSPANFISYADALAFCGLLSERLGRAVSLPTELQYEYVASGGVLSDFYWSEKPFDSVDCVVAGLGTAHFVHHGDPARVYVDPPVVAVLEPNLFGVYDSVGLIGEWVRDGYSGAGFLVDQTENLPGKAADVEFDAGPRRILKGGYFKYPLSSVGRWQRNVYFHNNARERFAGFRFVLYL